jgi:MFS family permease
MKLNNQKNEIDYKTNIWKLKFFIFFKSFQLFAGILIPFFINWGNVNFFQVSILLSIFFISIMIFEIPTGVLADTIGRKYSLFLSGLVGCLAILTYTIKPQFYIFVIGEILWGLSVALLHGAHESMFYDTLKSLNIEKESKKGFGKLKTYYLLGIGFAAPLGSLLVTSFGLRGVMMLSSIGPFIAMIIALTLKEPKYISKKNDYLNILKEGLKEFKKSNIVKILAFDQISNIIFIMFLFIAYQFALTDLNVDIKYFGWIHALLIVSQIIILNTFSFFENLLKSKRKTIFYFALIPAIAYIFMGLTEIIWLWILLLVIAQGVGYPREVLFINYHNKHIKSKNRATVLSVVSMIKNIVYAIFYPIAGFFMQMNWKMTLIAFGIIMILSQFISKIEEEHLID